MDKNPERRHDSRVPDRCHKPESPVLRPRCISLSDRSLWLNGGVVQPRQSQESPFPEQDLSRVLQEDNWMIYSKDRFIVVRLQESFIFQKILWLSSRERKVNTCDSRLVISTKIFSQSVFIVGGYVARTGDDKWVQNFGWKVSGKWPLGRSGPYMGGIILNFILVKWDLRVSG